MEILMSWIVWTTIALAALILLVKIRGVVLRKTLREERESAGLPKPTDRFEIIPKSDKKVRYKCGHDGWKDYVGHFFGDEMDPSKEMSKSREECPDCQIASIKPLTRRCALCGLPIMPGSPVALYGGPNAAFNKAWTTEVDGQAMGCMRWDCCPSGGFFAGHWTGEKFRSAFGANAGMVAAAAAMETGNMVIVSDVNDPSSVSVVDIHPDDTDTDD